MSLSILNFDQSYMNKCSYQNYQIKNQNYLVNKEKINFGTNTFVKDLQKTKETQKPFLVTMFVGFLTGIKLIYSKIKEIIENNKKQHLINNLEKEKEKIATMGTNDLVKKVVIPLLKKIATDPDQQLQGYCIKESIIPSLKKLKISNDTDSYILSSRRDDIRLKNGEINFEQYQDYARQRQENWEIKSTESMKKESNMLESILLTRALMPIMRSYNINTNKANGIVLLNNTEKMNDSEIVAMYEKSKRWDNPECLKQLSYDEIRICILNDELFQRRVSF